MPYLKVQHLSIPYTVVRSRRATKLRLEWHGTKAKLVCPHRCDNHTLLNFLISQSKWLVKQQRKSSRASENSAHVMWPTKISHGVTIPYLGHPLKLQIRFNALEAKVWRKHRVLMIEIQGAEFAHVERLLINWFRARALKLAIRWCQRFSTTLDRTPRSVRVKFTKSQWGSCGIHDDIFLNWQLVCFPPAVFKYVALHECCHLRYRNHGKRFWGLVEKHMPDFKDHERWLRQIMPWDMDASQQSIREGN